MDLSLVIPCYNEEGNVEKFFEEAERVFSLLPIKCEYIFVNDGSTDHTADKLEELFSSNPDRNITVINFSRNFGKESAIFAGLKNADGEYTCIIDADLQQRPETALEMLKYAMEHRDCDCVCAYQKDRNESKNIGLAKSAYYKLLNKIVETDIRNGASDFRLFKSKVRDAVISLGEYHRFSKGIFSWVGFNIHYMEYRADERNSGSSKWSFKALCKYAFGGILDFSTAPLKIATIIGSLATVFSIVYFIVTIIRKLTANISVDGFTQIVILITFFSGVLLFCVGIIGEYIARIYQQVKSRPIYIEDSRLSRKSK